MTERMGPGWLDSRPRIETFIDPLDISGMMKKDKHHTKYWEEAAQWPVCEDAFSAGTASNVRGRESAVPKPEAV